MIALITREDWSFCKQVLGWSCPLILILIVVCLLDWNLKPHCGLELYPGVIRSLDCSVPAFGCVPKIGRLTVMSVEGGQIYCSDDAGLPNLFPDAVEGLDYLGVRIK